MPTDDRLLRAALASGRIPGHLMVGVRALLNGFWLGVLDEERLEALMEHYFGADEAYTSVAYNERGLVEWEKALVAGVAPGARILVVGAGGGREVLGLLNAGYDAIGCEPHPGLVCWAQAFLAQRGYPDRIVRVAPNALPPDVTADAVLVGWTTYSFMPGRERRIAFLREAAVRLRGDGPLMLSCYERPAQGLELRFTAAFANALRSRNGAERVEVGDTLVPVRAHVFTRAELAAELAAAGFRATSFTIVGRDYDTNHAALVARLS